MNWLCRFKMHRYKRVYKPLGFYLLFGTHWADTGRMVCASCKREKYEKPEYAMMEGEL